LHEARSRIQQIWPDGAARRKAIDAALEPHGPVDVMIDHAAGDVDAWLDQPQGQTRSQVIDLELTSADPDDLTLRQARWLGQADQIFATSDVPEQILDRARADAQRFELSLWDEQPTTGLALRIRMKR
jgi:uroporphyrin-III C-methyltransferase/precorrin-2 dehydrogenase/sirohydrochlorin ferrochelatase